MGFSKGYVIFTIDPCKFSDILCSEIQFMHEFNLSPREHQHVILRDTQSNRENFTYEVQRRFDNHFADYS